MAATCAHFAHLFLVSCAGPKILVPPKSTECKCITSTSNTSKWGVRTTRNRGGRTGEPGKPRRPGRLTTRTATKRRMEDQEGQTHFTPPFSRAEGLGTRSRSGQGQAFPGTSTRSGSAVGNQSRRKSETQGGTISPETWHAFGIESA